MIGIIRINYATIWRQNETKNYKYLGELNAELEWYKKKYLEFKFQEMEVKNNGLV